MRTRLGAVLCPGYLCIVFMTLASATFSSSALATGGKPRDVAVSPDGNTIIVTSEASDDVLIVDSGNPTFFDLYPADESAHSWGVAFVDNATAIVTVPPRDEVRRLIKVSGSWIVDDLVTLGRYCTEVIASPNAGHVLIANRGETPSGAEDWKHAVYEVNAATGNVTATFVTERHPRALAVSPDGALLYVGHAFGALGGDGLVPDETFPGDPTPPFDGGSVVAFDMSTQNPLFRIATGSPVRGVATLAVDLPAGAHQVFFSHVGEGAQAESPGAGGRLIPNVVSQVLVDANHDPLARLDAIVSHLPEGPESGDLPEVLPGRLAVRDDPSFPSLWILNSASGTVTITHLDATYGFFQGTQNFDLLQFAAQDVVSATYNVVTGRAANETLLFTDASTSNVRHVFKVLDDQHTVTIAVDRLSPPSNVLFSSNPRGIAYSPATDDVYVVTHLDHELITIGGNTEAMSPTRYSTLSGTDPVIDDERDFFTFGEGFNFRENGPADMVDNLSCGTCHVDGHIDGKVRSTSVNTVVAVPSVFDVGNTEWLFFDGFKTILDDDTGCAYCEFARFFRNTPNFTNAAQSPRSPSADPAAAPANDDGLTSDQLFGRAWFDALNCSRCHQGPLPTFVRSDFAGNGPLVSDDSAAAANAERILNDRTQSFFTQGSPGAAAPGAARRNATNVGSRPGTNSGLIPTTVVNTPALAGAWDNGPYMHDGRHRTLDEVLADTWLKQTSDGCASGFFAAPLWECVGAGAVPDNFANVLNVSAGENLVSSGLVPHKFETHRPTRPGGGTWLSIGEYFDGNPGPAEGYDQLKAFLKALSSQTDPCAGDPLAIAGVTANYDAGTGTTTVSWNTSYPVACSGTWGEQGSATEPFETLVGTYHEVALADLDVCSGHEIHIDAERPRGVCDAESASTTYTWEHSSALAISNFTMNPEMDCSSNTITWNTNGEVACTVEWGIQRQGMPNSATTDPGTSHSFYIPTVPGTKYEVRVTAACGQGNDSEYDKWSTLYCIGKSETVVARRTGIDGVFPNPFNPRTEIRFGVATEGLVTLAIYDSSGRLVRSLVREALAVGQHVRVWDGRDDTGTPVAASVYHLRLDANGVHDRRKLVLVE